MSKILSISGGVLAGALGGALIVLLIAFSLYDPGPESWDFGTPILILAAMGIATLFGGALGAVAGINAAEGRLRRAAIVFGGAMASVAVLTLVAAASLWGLVHMPQPPPSAGDKNTWARARGPLDPQFGLTLARQLLDCHASSRGLTPDSLARGGCKSQLGFLIGQITASYDDFDKGWRWESVKTPRGYKVVVRPDPVLEQEGPLFEFDDDRLLVKRAEAGATPFAVETPLPALEAFRSCLVTSGPDGCRHLERERGPSTKHIFGPGESFTITLANPEVARLDVRLFPRGRYEEGRFELHVQGHGRRYMFIQDGDWHASPRTMGDFAYEKNPPPEACERDPRLPCPSDTEKLAGDARETLYKRLATRIRFALSTNPGDRVIVRYDPQTMPGLERALEQDLRAERVELIPYGPVDGFEERLANAVAYVWLPTTVATPPEQVAALARWTDRGGRRYEIHVHWMEGTLDLDGRPATHTPAHDTQYLAAAETNQLELMQRMDRVMSALATSEVRVTTPAGTDIRFRTMGRPFNRQYASGSNAAKGKIRVDRHVEIPPGVLRVAPLETTVNGVLVFPTFLIRDGVRAADVRLEFTNGTITRATAREGQGELDNYLRSQPALTHFREFCLGLNPQLAMKPGETVIPYYGYGAGVIRMSLGDNEELGGTVRGGAVRWNFFVDATVMAGDQVLVKDGRLTLNY